MELCMIIAIALWGAETQAQVNEMDIANTVWLNTPSEEISLGPAPQEEETIIGFDRAWREHRLTRKVNISVRTGKDDYCFYGEWEIFEEKGDARIKVTLAEASLLVERADGRREIVNIPPLPRELTLHVAKPRKTLRESGAERMETTMSYSADESLPGHWDGKPQGFIRLDKDE
jgi:hypothetical protein